MTLVFSSKEIINLTNENKMGTMPVNKLIITMSLPIIASMLIQALYNIVDSIYVAKLSEDALTAVSLAFPYQNLMIAVGTGTGVGVNAYLSRNLGMKDFETAGKTANVSIFLAIMSWLFFIVLAFTGARPFLNFQTDNQVISDMAHSYLMIVSCASIGLFGQICMERLLQATGKAVYSMLTQALGAILNIILDPIMIFGLGPVPAMGISGAALATVIAQFIATFAGIVFNIKLNKEITLRLSQIRPDAKIIKKIYSVGIPSILMASIGSVMTFCMNKILGGFTQTAVAVFGVYFKLQSFIFMPVFGLNNGIVPIMAYNLGARKTDRIKKTIKLGMIYASSFMIIGVILFNTIPQILLAMFDASEQMLAIGIPALKTICLHFIFAGISIVSISVFQSVGKGMYSLYISIARQLIVLIPISYLLSLSGNLNLVWFAFPIAEIVSVTLCLIMLGRVRKKIFETI